MPNLVASLLEASRRYPSKLAVTDTHRRLTFKQLTTFAAAMRGIVRRKSGCPRIGLLLPSSAAMAGSFYGTLWAGKTAVPLNFLLQPRELEGVVADAQIDTVITIEHFAPMVEAWPVKCLVLERLGLKAKVFLAKLRPWPEPPATAPDETAVMLYTSGTSGLPKGVCLSHHNLDWNSRACIEHARMNHDQRLLGVIPQFHTFGLTALLIVPITLGATVYYLPRFSATAAVKTIQENNISIFLAIPSMYNAIGRLKSVPDGALKSLTLVVSGGEPLPDQTARLFRDRFGIELLEGYGMTETSPVLTINMPWAHKPGTVGTAIPDVQLRIVDDENRDLPHGHAGEILAKGPGIMKGYYRKPEETRAVLGEDGWLHTGDIGALDADGYLTITGRKKEIIIVGGENVYPREVENVLVDHPAVSEAAVMGKQDPSRGEVVVAYVIPAEGSSITEIELRDYCRDRLASHKVPRQITITADLPRGPTGKILKRALQGQSSRSS
ncbi:MAG: AMP-binding protein [Phycisphaerales bacterium]|nr:MAG: AMP-binding protein [Phycisphaerales bacterium]